jgi:hypothetical protein
MNQEDSMPPGGNDLGDACECEGDFDCDGDQDGSDAATFKIHFGRSTFSRPCTPEDPCYGDFDADGDADGTDAATFKLDFGRSGFSNPCPACTRPVGVLLAVHGGMDIFHEQYLWDGGLQQFSYDPQHSVYKSAIWNHIWWPLILQTEGSMKSVPKYDFSYARIGGTDPQGDLTLSQLSDMEANLATNPYGIDFEVDWVGWMCGDCIDHYPYPRFMYYGPDGLPGGEYEDLTYCGEAEPGGAWAGCDSERYNVDGPVERILKKGVSRIIVVDLTVGGVRFFKTHQTVQMIQRVLDDWQAAYGVSIPLTWVNDYSDLMNRSYPIEPEGWTTSWPDGLPTLDSEVLLNGSPNPIASDSDLAALHVQSIEASMSGSVPDADTGVLMINHALRNHGEVYDPKMDDTIVLNENIKSQLLANHPTMDPDNIVGGRMGIKEDHPTHPKPERTRFMRGENLGFQYLYETDKEFPSSEGYPDPSDPRGKFHPWGYLFWDGLEYLKNRGVQHIVIEFNQVIVSSVLDMVEIPNQVGKEIGIKNWLKWGTWDYTRFPTVGHPFADYWGNWVFTECAEWELQFDGGTDEIVAGGINATTLVNEAMLVGQTSGATASIKEVILESGSWDTDDAAGKIILKQLTGSFLDDEIIYEEKNDRGEATANGTETQTISSECCFEMGGCPDDGLGLPRPYPPPRLTPVPDRAYDMDPSLAYDLSDFGHLGYDPGVGAPNPNSPVQDQYTGTWAMYEPPDDDPGVGALLAKHVINSIVKPMVYLSNGETASITEGESVTFQAHLVTGGTSPYTYEWSTNKDDAGWVSQGTGSSWTFNTTGGDAGTYAVRCVTTDSLSETGEVTWNDFVVSTP